MDVSLESLKKRGNAMAHGTTMLAVFSLLGINVYGDNVGLATRAYVNEKIEESFAQVDKNSEALSRILEIQLAEQIDKLLRWKCMNPRDTQLDTTLRALLREYRQLTGSAYNEPSCERLMQ